ncbi:MAG: PDDEXK nuclease domain-containing protein [Prevotellaceae bacterium]|jgi:predicted nuclease of restriction endonuclease-like (RecB) superfamily|nr:PDDEXK nuclease domain-containing protein [Prevotellaceae bacterium]
MSKTKRKLYNQIADLLLQARKVTMRAINRTMVYTYYEIGRMIVEDEQQGAHRAEYGNNILKELSVELTKNFGKGFSETNLKQMRSFYILYSPSISTAPPQKLQNAENEDEGIRQTLSDELQNAENEDEGIRQTLSDELQNADNEDIVIRQTLSDELQNVENEQIQTVQTLPVKSLVPEFRLSWSHYLKLMRIENEAERKFYEIESINSNWSLRELQRQFNSALYERLVLSRDRKKMKELSTKGQIIENPKDAIKDPLVLEFLGLPELAAFSETDLEQSIINKLENFLLELGKGFTFVGRQVRFTFDEKHFKVDLVFYNRLLKCFVLIDLKIGELTHQDLGQLQMYVNYYDRFVKIDDENKTVGIILCKEKNDTLVEITLPQDNTQIFASKYQTVLPSKEELRYLIESRE